MVGRMDGRRERGKDPEEGRANVYQKVKSFFSSEQAEISRYFYFSPSYFFCCVHVLL